MRLAAGLLAIGICAAVGWSASRPAPEVPAAPCVHADEPVLERTEAVENDAARQARSETKAERLAGLDLLDRLDIDNPDTRGLVLEIMRTDRDAEIVAAAIYALVRGVPSPAETKEVVLVLSTLLSHAEPEVRRRALIAWADWSADSAPLVAALGDPSVDVRAGAAFAVGLTRADVPRRGEILAAIVADEGEDWAVRDVAWHALARMPTDAATWPVVEDFRARREAYGEVAAGPEQP